MSQIRRVAIIGGNRIPFMRSNTAYSYASNMDMLSATLQGLVQRFELDGATPWRGRCWRGDEALSGFQPSSRSHIKLRSGIGNPRLRYSASLRHRS